MVASGRVAYLARRGADYGVQTGPVTVDMTKVRQRKRNIVESFRTSGQRRIEQTEGVDLLIGEAAFTGPKTLEVRLSNGETRQLTASTMLINAGARPAKPSLTGIEDVATLDSTSIMELDTVPEHLLVVGGGYIGLEFGQMFRRFGSQVTIIHQSDHILPREDDDVTDELKKALESEGIRFLLNAQANRVQKPVSKSKDGRVSLAVDGSDGQPRSPARTCLSLQDE